MKVSFPFFSLSQRDRKSFNELPDDELIKFVQKIKLSEEEKRVYFQRAQEIGNGFKRYLNGLVKGETSKVIPSFCSLLKGTILEIHNQFQITECCNNIKLLQIFVQFFGRDFYQFFFLRKETPLECDSEKASNMFDT